MNNNFPFDAIANLSFKRVPTTLPADLRPLRKLGIILLFLHMNSRRGTASMLKIQLLNWVLQTEAMMNWLLEGADKQGRVYTLNFIHLDPAINRAIEFAVAEGIITIAKTGKIAITEKGTAIASAIQHDDELFEKEKAYLAELGKSVSEVRINNIFTENKCNFYFSQD